MVAWNASASNSVVQASVAFPFWQILSDFGIFDGNVLCSTIVISRHFFLVQLSRKKNMKNFLTRQNLFHFEICQKLEITKKHRGEVSNTVSEAKHQSTLRVSPLCHHHLSICCQIP
jgi:hypothetical protein